MPGVALIAYFDGDAEQLWPRLHAALLRYSQSADTPQADTTLILRNKDGLAAVLVWPEGASFQTFRKFLRASIDELGLPRPRVEHYRAGTLL